VSTSPNCGGQEKSSSEKRDKVSFRVSDVFLPDVEELRAAWGDTAEVEGTIVDFSDSGSASRVFAVIEVLQRHIVVVPVAKLTCRSNPA
jgi:hypothetical protein